MDILRNKIVALIVSFDLVLVSIFVIGAAQIRANKAVVQSDFFVQENALSIQSQLDTIFSEAQNMLTVARRYASANHPQVEAIENTFAMIDTIPHHSNAELYQAVNQLINQVEALHGNRSNFNMTERDLAYFYSIMVNIESSGRIINNNNFNQQAAEFNDTLRSFPANVISAVRGISPIYLYQ